MFGRKNEDGTVSVLDDGGMSATRIAEWATVYPLKRTDDGWRESTTSCAYEHPEGIVVTASDAARMGLEIEQ